MNFGPVYEVQPGDRHAQVLVICEHASNRIPDSLNGLGLTTQDQTAHIAWDPGALGVARGLAAQMGAPLVSACISRLVYDLNRPPDSPDAMRDRSEVYDIPGNKGLSEADKQARADGIYAPFHKAVSDTIALHPSLRAFVTVHSFTPVFQGQPRSAELGILHGLDISLAQSMMGTIPDGFGHDIRLNEPYAAIDGVAHTLDKHHTESGLANVMLEIRNDLIANVDQQAHWAELLAPWIRNAMTRHRKDTDT